jgi:hypothetical protein
MPAALSADTIGTLSSLTEAHQCQRWWASAIKGHGRSRLASHKGAMRSRWEQRGRPRALEQRGRPRALDDFSSWAFVGRSAAKSRPADSPDLSSCDFQIELRLSQPAARHRRRTQCGHDAGHCDRNAASAMGLSCLPDIPGRRYWASAAEARPGPLPGYAWLFAGAAGRRLPTPARFAAGHKPDMPRGPGMFPKSAS